MQIINIPYIFWLVIYFIWLIHWIYSFQVFVELSNTHVMFVNMNITLCIINIKLVDAPSTYNIMWCDSITTKRWNEKLERWIPMSRCCEDRHMHITANSTLQIAYCDDVSMEWNKVSICFIIIIFIFMINNLMEQKE